MPKVEQAKTEIFSIDETPIITNFAAPSNNYQKLGGLALYMYCLIETFKKNKEMKKAITKIEEIEQNKVDDPIDKCVICGADTPYRFSTPISQREYYVEGSGQICLHCHYEIYIKKNR